MKKILLIGISASYERYCLSLATLSSSLEADPEISQEYNVSIRTYGLNTPNHVIIDDIVRIRPDVIGFSSYVWNVNALLNISNKLKKRLPDCFQIMGGPGIIANANLIFESNYSIDAVVYGEAEYSLPQIIKKVANLQSNVNLPGCFFRENKGMILDDILWPTVDFANIPSPYLNGKIPLKRINKLQWEISRGCPYNCFFCLEGCRSDGVRAKSFDLMREEIKYIGKFNNIKDIWLIDSTFNYNTERAKIIVNMLLGQKHQYNYSVECRAELLDKELVDLFSKGRFHVQIGLQTTNEFALQTVNRNADIDVLKERISLLNHCTPPVKFGIDLIYGLPGDSLEGFNSTLGFAASLGPDSISMFRLSILPGTQLWDYSANLGIKFLKNPPYYVISTPDFSESDLDLCDNEALELSGDNKELMFSGRIRGERDIRRSFWSTNNSPRDVLRGEISGGLRSNRINEGTRYVYGR